LSSDDYLDLRLGEFLSSLAARERAPGGGSAAALTVALAAGLVSMVARSSRATWTDAGAVAAQAASILERIKPLVRADADVWETALAELRAAAEGETTEERALERKLEAAAAVPIAIAEVAADTASLAELAADRGDGAYRADAAVAALLAAAAAQAAFHLVEVNLAVRGSDARLAEARGSAESAATAAARALDAAG
jgi:methenyltetrahydrofolate cyclohydrolase